jgi:hypothetical protein
VAHPPPYPDKGDDTGGRPEPGTTTGTSRWVSVLVIVMVIGLIALIVVLHLTGSVGPGAHE